MDLSLFKKKLTEQVNVVSIFLTVVLSAIAYGWIEGTIYPYYPYKDQLQIMGHFSWYHLAFCLMFLVISFTFSLNRALAMWSLRKGYMFAASLGSVLWGFWMEDMAYFSVVRDEVLGPESWVNWFLSGIFVFGHWVPTVYFLLSFIGFALFSVAFIRSSRDALIMMKAKEAGKSREEMRLRVASRSVLAEFLRYCYSVIPFAFAVLLIAVSAASLVTSALLRGALLAILVGLTVLVPTSILLIFSNTIYDWLSKDLVPVSASGA